MKKAIFAGVTLASLLVLAGPYGPWLNQTMPPGYLYLNGPSTNNGVYTLNSLNILVSPNTNTIVFTNAVGAIGIGWNFPFSSILGNGIWLGGGGAGNGGDVGTNGIVFGAGAAASGGFVSGVSATNGVTTIGNQIDNFGILCTMFGNAAADNLGLGDSMVYMFGDNNGDQAAGPYTNIFYFGQNAGNITLHNNTIYLGSASPINTTGIVFNSSAPILCNGQNITNLVGDLNINFSRVFRPKNTVVGSTYALNTNVAYFVYIGQTDGPMMVNSIEAQVTAAVVGGSTSVGLFSTPAPPNKTGQTLTKLIGASSGVIAGAGIKGATGLGFTVPAHTYLWAGWCTTNSNTAHTLIGLSYDNSEGQILYMTNAGKLTDSSTFSGTVPALNTATVAPEIRVTVD